MKKIFFKSPVFFTMGGVLLLSFLSVFQKYALGADPFTPKGFIIPVIFGGFSGFIFGYWLERYNTANKQIIQNEKKMRALFNSQLNGILIVDITTLIITDLNRAASIMLNSDIENIKGSKYENIFFIKDKEDNFVEKKKIDSGSHEVFLKRFSGEMIPVLKNTVKLNINSKEYYAISFIDISKEKKLESQLNISQKLEALGTLSGGIAHDFNNILLGIIGHTEIALSKLGDNSPATEHLNKVLNAVDRAKDLIDRILLFSKSTGKDMRIIEITRVISDIKELVEGSLQSNIKMEISYPDKKCLFRGSYSQIYQTLLNLISNATFAMKMKGGKLSISVEYINRDRILNLIHSEETIYKKFVKLSIKDTGEGIPENLKSRVFDPFFSTKKVGEGTGMGLSIVYKIVKNHNGFINIESKKGEGTEVCIYLPEIESEPKEQQQEKFDEVGGNESIMLIDDDDMVSDVIQNLLTTLGYKVKKFKNGNNAIEYLRRNINGFEMIISDQVMPDISGIEIAKKVKQLKSSIPFVIVTGRKNIFYDEDIKELGIDMVISKPFSTKEFSNKIRLVLDKSIDT